MTTIRTYLTLVIQYEGDMIRATSSFREDEIRQQLDALGICWPADRKEVRLVYSIEPPLSPELLEELTLLKECGMCTNFYVKDEISSE